MALNIFPRRREGAPPDAPAVKPGLPGVPEAAVAAQPEAEPKTRRGTRGGRARTRSSAAGTAVREPEAKEPAPADGAGDAPRGRRRTAKVEPKAGYEPAAGGAGVKEAGAGTRRAAKAEQTVPPAATGDALAKALELQTKQIAALARAVEELGSAAKGPQVAAPPPRVGVFVDAANVELAFERQRLKIDWKKVLASLTQERRLVRAVAYCPVHDDPGVSIESQRFVEPFLSSGFRVVTKPLRRFADGTIKANIDIELTLDIVGMLDRLDVVVLGSGDGDFLPLVEVVQAKGVRVEVVSVGPATASQLRNAADEFVDLGARVREFRS